MACAKFFYSCNISFLSADNENFRKFIEILRPGYKPPDRKALAGPLLDQTYGEIMEGVTSEIGELPGSCAITISQDGWSNIHNEPLIVSSLCVNFKPYILKSTEAKSTKKTSEYCAELAKLDIEFCQEKYGKHVKKIFFNILTILLKNWFFFR